MALWMIEGRKDYFDDGETAKPGDEDFSTDKVKAEAGSKGFNYVGTPNWEPALEPEPDE